MGSQIVLFLCKLVHFASACVCLCVGPCVLLTACVLCVCACVRLCGLLRSIFNLDNVFGPFNLHVLCSLYEI